MADVNDIVVFGFGGWSSVNWIPTLGFSIAVPVTGPLVFEAVQINSSGVYSSEIDVGLFRQSQSVSVGPFEEMSVVGDFTLG